MYPPLVLRTRRLKSGCPRAGLPAEAPGECPPRLFRLLGAAGVRPWAGGCLPPVSASVSTWLLRCVRVSPLPCLIRTLSWGFRVTLIQEDLISDPYSITAAETLLLNKVLFTGSGLAGRQAICSASVQPLWDPSKGHQHLRERGVLFCFDRSCCSRKGRRSSKQMRVGSVGTVQRLAWSVARGIFPAQGSNPSLLHWQVDCFHR